MPAHHRHVAGVVMCAFVLLVGLVVLFIDHDQPQTGIGQKQRRARADHDRRFAGGDRGPVAGAGARRQFGMPFQRPHAEAQREAIQELSGQRDLRHQDQRLLAAANGFRNRLEIDFGLARTGDAIEQRDMKAAIGRERAHRIHGGALLTGKFRFGERRIGRRRRQRPRHHLDRQRAFIDQAIDHAGADAGFARGFGFAVQQTIRQNLDQPPPRRGHAPRHFADQPHAHPHPLGAEILAHPQRHAHDHAARRQRVVGDPVDQVAQFFFQRRHVELFADVLEAVVQARIRVGVFGPDHGDHLARPKRHAHHIARLQFHAARHPVRIGLIERNRHQHIDDARRRCRCGIGAREMVHRRIRLGGPEGPANLRPQGRRGQCSRAGAFAN